MFFRKLEASDASSFQALRLHGLAESPSAFSSSYDEERIRTVEQIQAHLAGSPERAFFGCFQEVALIGVVGVGREQAGKLRHIAFVRSMYVAPTSRGLGVGRGLLTSALEHAFNWVGVEQVTLNVTATNVQAVNLYRTFGFLQVGRMPRALRLEGEYFDELAMVRVATP